MVKSVLGVNHQGLRDWVIQRVSAVYMAIYTISLITCIICHRGLSYAEWRGIFLPVWVKVATIIFVVSVMFHAWIGMWTIFTDYVKPFVLRCILNVLVILTLTACFIWAVMILWSL